MKNTTEREYQRRISPLSSSIFLQYQCGRENAQVDGKRRTHQQECDFLSLYRKIGTNCFPKELYHSPGVNAIAI
jgi:hypothetical protein